MTLSEYLKSPEGLGATKLAAALGIHRRYIYQIAHGQRCPSLPVVIAIYHATQGAVTPFEYPQAESVTARVQAKAA
jgi:DNA-binding transcriptional regulator YdaS (Cro superfamily)